MRNDRKSIAIPILAAVLCLTLPLLYVGGYLALSDVGDNSSGQNIRARLFAARWQAILYWPAMYVEGATNSISMVVIYPITDEIHTVEGVYAAD